MIPTTIAEVAGHELIWVQPAFSKPDYELRAAGNVFACLSGHQGECLNHTWLFRWQGWLRRRVAVQALSPITDSAVFKWRPREAGTLEIPEGRTFHFGAAKHGSSLRYDWLGPDGLPLVHFQTRAGFDLSEALVEIEDEGARLTELPLLVVLGQFLAVRLAERRGDPPGAWSIWDWIDIPWPTLPELPDFPGLPDIDW